MAEDKDTFDTAGLDALIRAFKGERQPVAHVGILNDKPRTEGKTTLTYKEVTESSGRRKSGKVLSNAELGAIHEFGDSTHPQRSFLRVPIADRLQKEMEAAGAFDKRSIEEMLKQHSLLPFVRKLAILGEKIVLEAFSTGGFGKWPPWKGSYTNNTGQILVDTTQLRNSISSAVVDG